MDRRAIEAWLEGVDRAGEILPREDGALAYWPMTNGVHLTAQMLRALAEELDVRNAPWEEEVKRERRGGARR
jgi:hypothetical protein